MDKNHKDPDTIDLSEAASCTIHAQSMEETSQYGVLVVDINLAIRKGLKFYQTTIERYHSSMKHFPAYCIPKVVQDGNWRSHVRKSIHVTSASTKDLFET